MISPEQEKEHGNGELRDICEEWDVPPCNLVEVYRCCLLLDCTSYPWAPEMETVIPSEAKVNLYQTTRRHIPGHSHRRQNIKANILFVNEVPHLRSHGRMGADATRRDASVAAMF